VESCLPSAVFTVYFKTVPVDFVPCATDERIHHQRDGTGQATG
jgi:hypothetical protein